MDIKDAETRFALLAESLPQLVWTTDPEGRHDYFNLRWYEFTGLQPAESMGHGWIAALHPDDVPLARERWALALATGSPYEIEYRIRNTAGSYVWFLGRALPIRDPAGAVARWIGTCTDISGQKRAEDALRRLDAQHRLALEAAGLGTWSHDLETGIVSWDERACVLFGTPIDSIRSVAFEKSFVRVHPDDEPTLRAHLAAVVSPDTDDAFEVEYRIVLPGGTIRWIRANGRAFREGPEGRPVRLSGVCGDVTERRAVREAHELLTSELNHRVKNLFAIASGLVAMTARTARDPKEMAVALRGRLGALSRAHELVRPAAPAGTSLGGSQAGLAELIDVLLAPYREDGRARIILEGPEVRLGPGAMTSLALVLHEFTTNAAKYGSLSTEHGDLSVTWILDDATVRVTWAETGGPPILTQPTFEGFGSVLSERTVSGQLGGALARHWRPEGLLAHMDMPVERLGV
ncbi:MAG: PAS domain-containing protein [Microvirga sp.]